MDSKCDYYLCISTIYEIKVLFLLWNNIISLNSLKVMEALGIGLILKELGINKM
jgi:hypothetical protein